MVEPKKVPSSLRECMEPCAAVSELVQWSKSIEILGKVAFWIILVGTVVLAVVMTAMDPETNGPLAFLGILVKGAIAAIVENIVYHVISVCIGSYAQLVWDTQISASVALFEENRKIEVENANV